MNNVAALSFVKELSRDPCFTIFDLFFFIIILSVY